MTYTVIAIPVVEITRGDNDRTVFDEADLRELAASIAKDGLDQPITVRPIAPGSRLAGLARYEIVAGERRYRATCMAGLMEIPAIVRELSDEAAARLMFHENIKRKDIDPVDEAGVYRKWMTKAGLQWDLDRCAAEAGKDKTHILKRLALLELLPEVQTMVRKKQLPLAHAEAMVCMKGADGARAALNGWSQSQAVKALGNAGRMPNIADFRQMCGELLAAQQQATMFDLDSWAVAFETGRKRIKPTGLARHPRMPRLNANKNTGLSLLSYIEQLRAAGLESEALVASHILDELVQGNLTTI